VIGLANVDDETLGWPGEFMRRLFHNHGLTIVLVGLFLFSIVGQSVAGWLAYNDEQRDHAQSTVSLPEYLVTGDFVESVFENWESEFLQMGVYVLLTAFLHQKGSAESKSLDDDDAVDEDPRSVADRKGVPWPVRHGGFVLTAYEHSLSLALLGLFAVSFLLHAAGGARAYSQDALLHGGEAVSLFGYLATARFWFESFQNWQSEFLSIATVVILSIFLRERGSPESKPVAAPHHQTGEAA
jgi:hypothetical protein